MLRYVDSRGYNPLQYVHRDHWLQWCAFLFHHRDKYWSKIDVENCNNNNLNCDGDFISNQNDDVSNSNYDLNNNNNNHNNKNNNNSVNKKIHIIKNENEVPPINKNISVYTNKNSINNNDLVPAADHLNKKSKFRTSENPCFGSILKKKQKLT
jgi:hypothetical protein